MTVMSLARSGARNGPATRQAILDTLRRHPGLTKSQLCRRLGLAWGTVSYHVRVLERERTVTRRRFLGLTRLNVRGDSPEASLMPLLREAMVPHLLERLGVSPGTGIQELSRELSLSRKVVRRKLEALVASGLLERTDEYRPRFFLLEKGRAMAAPGAEGTPGPRRPSEGEGERLSPRA